MARRNKPGESVEERKEKRRAERMARLSGGAEANRYYNLGGHMIDPPEDCTKKKSSSDGGIWVDLALCRLCDSSKICDRYTSFMNKSQAERNEDSRSRGVKLTNSWQKNAEHSEAVSGQED